MKCPASEQDARLMKRSYMKTALGFTPPDSDDRAVDLAGFLAAGISV